MKNGFRSCRSVVFLALATLALTMPGTHIAADSGPEGLVIQGHAVVGNVVVVTIENTASSARSGTVVGEVRLVSGATEVGSRSMSLAAGQTTSVALLFTSPVGHISDLQITDDPNPIGG